MEHKRLSLFWNKASRKYINISITRGWQHIPRKCHEGNYAWQMYQKKCTRKADVHRKEQRIRDILGKQVGRVSANLCRVFGEVLRRGMTEGPIMCYYGGSAGHSKDPHYQKAFKRACTRYGTGSTGRGAEPNCSYF